MKKMMENFIFGTEKAPAWFDQEANAGRVKLLYDEDDQLVGARILSGMKTYEAKVGDSIMNTKYGLAVIPREKAKQYGVQNKDAKKEKEISEEKTEE